MRYRSFDLYILIVFVIIGFIGGHQLFADSVHKQKDEGAVATLVSITDTVKEKPHGMWAWEDAGVGSPLFLGDQVYTYEKSGAQVLFEQGHQIHIGQNTLFKIASDNRKASVDLQRGIITADLAKGRDSLEIKIDGKEYVLESNGARVQIISDRKGKKINLLTGEVQIQNEKKQKVSLTKNQYWHYQQGHIAVKSYNIELKKPLEGELLIYGQYSSVHFEWEKKDLGEHLLVVALDDKFQEVVRTRKLTGHFAKVHDLNDGHYFWRIENAAGQVVSRLGSFALRHDRPLEIYGPEDGFVSHVIDADACEVLLEWEERDYDLFDVEIEHLKQGRRRIERVAGAATFQLLKGELGFYRFRVRPLWRNKVLSWSAWSHFAFRKMEQPRPPLVVYPKDNVEVTFFDHQQASIDLRWLPQKGIRRYQLVISDEQKHIVEGDQYLFVANKPGQYKWKIRSLDPRGGDSLFGREYSFVVNFIQYDSLAPANGALVELKKPNQQVHFEWKEVRKSRYLFQLSKNRDFQRIEIEKKVKSNRVHLRFPHIGTYFWRIKILDGQGNVTFSKPVKVEVSPVPPPEKPDQLIDDSEVEIEFESASFYRRLENRLGGSVDAKGDSQIAKIKWKRDENAAKYLVEIYSDSQMKKLYFKKEVTENNLKLEGVRAGIYFWRIAVIDHWKRQSPFSDLYRLMLKIPEEYQHFKAPVISQKRLEKQFLHFAWKEPLKRVQYTLEVASDDKFLKLRQQKRLKRRHEVIKLGQRGSYFLRIIAEGEFVGKVIGPVTKIVYKGEEKKKPQTVVVKSPKKHHINFYYNPELVSYEQVAANHDVDVDGVALNGFIIEAKYRLDHLYSIDLFVKRIAGKVFNDNTLIDFDGQLVVMRNLYSRGRFDFNAGIGAYLNVSRYYQYVNEEQLKDARAWQPGAIIKAQSRYRWQNRQNFIFEVGAGFLTQTLIGSQAIYEFIYSPKIHFLGGIHYNYRKMSREGVSSYSIGLNAGVRLLL